MEINISWILKYIIGIIPVLVALIIIKSHIKDVIRSYFFDGSLNIESINQLPNNRKRNKMLFSTSFAISIQALGVVAFIVIIMVSSEDKQIKIPNHFFDIMI